MKDTFKYEDRWNSVGLCCACCRHQANDQEWPNTKRDYMCGLHHVSLAAELAPTGFMQGEWFCRDFDNNGKAHPNALKHFQEIHSQLSEKVLFGFYGTDDNLKEIPFSELKNFT